MGGMSGLIKNCDESKTNPSGASSKECGLVAMDGHPVVLRMFGNQSEFV